MPDPGVFVWVAVPIRPEVSNVGLDGWFRGLWQYIGESRSILARRYGVGDTTYFSIVAGRIGGFALKSVSGGYYFQTPALTTNSTMIVSFGYKQDYAINNYGICAMYDGATEGMNLQLTSTGAIQVCRGGTVLTTTAALISLTTWYFIEFKVVCGPAGSYELRVNGTTVASASGVNTQAGSDAYHDRVAFLGGAYSNPCTDDFFVLDGTGSVNKDFLGNHKIVAMLPASAGDSSDWTPTGSANHYATVNENPPDDDTTYVQDSTTGHKDLWGYSTLTGLGAIAGIQVNTEAKLSDVGSLTLKTYKVGWDGERRRRPNGVVHHV